MKNPKINIPLKDPFALRIEELVKSGKTIEQAYAIYHKEIQKTKDKETTK